MNELFTDAQVEAQKDFEAFVESVVAPRAEEVDREQAISNALIDRVASKGLFGAGVSAAYGGLGDDPVTVGLLHEALGRASASVQGLVNVHHMAMACLARWGTAEQKAMWLPQLTSGKLVAGFALTEAEAGSDARVRVRAESDGDAYLVTGEKKWITLGARADVFVLFARCGEAPVALIVPGDLPGLARTEIRDMLGCRGYMMASLNLERCRVPKSHRLGQEGFSTSHVMNAGLDQGRYNLSWSCVGQAIACLDASRAYAGDRVQFGERLDGFQLVKQLLTRMMVATRGARLACFRAGVARKHQQPTAVLDAMMAKYQASTALREVVDSAVQIHGARGCTKGLHIERRYRDAKIMEIIEGSTQLLEVMIADLSSGSTISELL